MNGDPRWAGVARVLGEMAAGRLQQARVCVVGLGGVGSWAVEALARSGVGHLWLVDGDDICISNTNRQLHALAGQYGRMKAQVLAERVEAIHPDAKVEVVQRFVTPDGVAEQLPWKEFDLLLDAIDHVPAKVALIAHARRVRKPLVVTGGAGGRVDPLAVQRADLSRTRHDPLLSSVRRRLRREHGFPANPARRFGVPCVFSVEQPRYPDGQGGWCARPAGQGGARMDCDGGLGAFMPVTAAFGLAAAALAMERLTGGLAQASGTSGRTLQRPSQ